MMDDSVLKNPVRVFFFAIRQHRLLVLGIFILIICGNVFSYSVPYFLKEIGDIAAAKIGGATFHDFILPFIGIVVLFIAGEICYRTGHALEVYVAPRILSRITSALFAWVLLQPTAYFEEHLSGELGRRVEQIALNVLFFIDSLPSDLGWQLIGVIVTTVLLMAANTVLAATFLIWLLFFVLTSYPLLRWQHRAAKAAATSQANLSGQTVDAFGNIATVHTFGAYEHEQGIYSGILTTTVAAERHSRMVGLANKAQLGTSVVILSVALIAVSIWLFTLNKITVGDFVLVGTAVITFGGIVWNMGDLLLRSIRNYGEFQSAVQGLKNEVKSVSDGTKALVVSDAKVVFQDVTFAYPSSSLATLQHFTLQVNPGEKVGLVGKSGAGKSTVVKLLLRQYDPTGGSIHVGGENIEEVTLTSLRKNIAFVAQDTALFQRTLYENILYAKPEATEEEVLAASKRAHAHDFISQYPTGYMTKVGERGVKLSGGQRQRVALARAMLKNAPILVLDEATSALDSESEEIVQKGLEELFSQKTVIAIAHRLSTLRAMDRIVVLDEGHVVEDSSPQELLSKSDSIFKSMWEHQKSGFIT